MKCFAVCQEELVIRMLDQVLVPTYEVEFVVESRTLARRLHDAGLPVTAGGPRRVDTYLKPDVNPGPVVLVEANGRRSLRRVVEAVREAGGTLIYIVGSSPNRKRSDEARAQFPEVTHLSGAELAGQTLLSTGTRQVVFVEVSPGHFQPRDVQAGLRADGRVIVRSGLREGEQVATAANFLLDSESRLRAALNAAAPAEPAHVHLSSGSGPSMRSERPDPNH